LSSKPSKLKSRPSGSRNWAGPLPGNSRSSYAKKSEADTEELLGPLGFEIRLMDPLFTPSVKTPVPLVMNHSPEPSSVPTRVPEPETPPPSEKEKVKESAIAMGTIKSATTNTSKVSNPFFIYASRSQPHGF